MAKATITYLADDFDGSDADETVKFSLDAKAYEIDLSKANAAKMRKAFKPYIEAGRAIRGRAAARKSAATRGKAGTARKATAFSKLDSGEKDRFRAWAKLPNARRIADARVREWIKAGKP